MPSLLLSRPPLRKISLLIILLQHMFAIKSLIKKLIANGTLRATTGLSVSQSAD